MRNISAPLKAAILAGKRASLVKITTQSGTVFAYTDHDFPLTVSGTLYTPAPGLKRLQLNSTTDDRVSNQEFASAWVDAPEQDLLAGKFDDAEIEVAFCAWDDVSLGRVIIDKGNLGVIQWTEDGFKADVQNHMRKLKRNISFVTTSSCRHVLFSQFSTSTIGACTLNAASFTGSGTISLEVTPRVKFRVTGLAQAAGYFNNGVLTFTSGIMNGTKHEVKFHTVGANTEIEMFLPIENLAFTGAGVVGTTFSVAAGCDKSITTCKNKFNNVINFGGFPHIQTEIQYR